MEFNTSKYDVLHITRNCHPHIQVYKLKGQVLDPVHSVKYLGVYLSDDLRWNKHIKTISNKVNKTLGFLKRNLIHCPPRTKETAYKALVRTQNTVHLCGIHIQLKTQTWLRWSKGELEKSHFRGTEAFCYEFLLLKYRNNTFL